MPDPIPVYFDACVFIELIQQGRADRLDDCLALWDRAKKKELIIVTSAITITEVIPHGEKSAPKWKKVREFFENEEIAVRSVDRRTSEESHRLMEKYGLTNFDAIHVATALLSESQVLYTYDGISNRKKRGLIQHSMKFGGREKLKIEVPPDHMKGTLLARPKSECAEQEQHRLKGASLAYEGEVAASAPASSPD